MGRWPGILLVRGGVLPVPGGPAGAAEAQDRERRCLTMIAYAEAGGEGSAGMLAVMKVVRNRIADPSFADDACAVALEPGQFQPVAERPALRRALAVTLRAEPGRGAQGKLSRGPPAPDRSLAACRCRCPTWPARDPTGGALYFVNPRLMDPAKCPWFAALKRTAAIGQHVFMTSYIDGEQRRGPALDCRMAGKDYRTGPGYRCCDRPLRAGRPKGR